MYHDSMFFMRCTARLEQIVMLFHSLGGIFPDFSRRPTTNEDAALQFFRHDDEIFIDESYCVKHRKAVFNRQLQFTDYRKIDYETLCPFVEKYFTPTTDIETRVDMLLSKYELECDKTCVLSYHQAVNNVVSYKVFNEMFARAHEILMRDPSVKFLLHSDDAQFLSIAQVLLPDAIVFENMEFDTGGRRRECDETGDRECDETEDRECDNTKWVLAESFVISKCKYIVCNSNSHSMWICLFRGNAGNVIQCLHL